MSAMVGGLAIRVIQRVKGGERVPWVASVFYFEPKPPSTGGFGFIYGVYSLAAGERGELAAGGFPHHRGRESPDFDGRRTPRHLLVFLKIGELSEGLNQEQRTLVGIDWKSKQQYSGCRCQ